MTSPAHGLQSDLTLAINAAEGMVQLAFANEDGRLLCGTQIAAASRGAEILAPALDAALTLLDKKPGNIARVAAVTGPGSFTGIRLAISTAGGIARAVNAKQAPLDYMRLIAWQCLPFLAIAEENAVIWVITRARRDLVYSQAFTRNSSISPAPTALTGIETACVSSGQAARLILDTAACKAGRVLLAGSGVTENQEALIRHLSIPGAPRMIMLPVTSPTVETLISAAMNAAYAYEDLAPGYIRPSDAEENLPRIAAALGLDPAEAVERLTVLTSGMPGD